MEKQMTKELTFAELALVAESRVRELFGETPCQKNDHLSAEYGAEIWLKREDLTPVRSYKLRGAWNAIQNARAKNPDADLFVCASAGNQLCKKTWSNTSPLKPQDYSPVFDYCCTTADVSTSETFCTNCLGQTETAEFFVDESQTVTYRPAPGGSFGSASEVTTLKTNFFVTDTDYEIYTDSFSANANDRVTSFWELAMAEEGSEP